MLPERIPRITPPGPPANISREERKARRALGRTRLNKKLISDYAALITAAYPPALAARFLGLSNTIVNDWHAIANFAAKKHPDERTQFERECIKFHLAVERAVGDAGLRTHRAIAEAGGILRAADPPVIRTTTTRRDAEGNLIETVTVERTIPADWRAAAHVARYRFPIEMGAIPEPDEEGTLVGADLTPAAIVSLIASVKRQRREAGIIDANATEE